MSSAQARAMNKAMAVASALVLMICVVLGLELARQSRATAAAIVAPSPAFTVTPHTALAGTHTQLTFSYIVPDTVADLSLAITVSTPWPAPSNADVSVTEPSSAFVSVVDDHIVVTDSAAVQRGDDIVIGYDPPAVPYASLDKTPFAYRDTSSATPVGGSADVTISAQCPCGATGTIQTATTTSLSSSVDPSLLSQRVTLTATVSPFEVSTPPLVTPVSQPTGTVTFFSDRTVLGTAPLAATATGTNMQASWPTSTLPVGNHSITAVYMGDTNFGGSTSLPLRQSVQQQPPPTVHRTTISLSSLQRGAYLGQAVILTASVTDADSPSSKISGGTVQLIVDGDVLRSTQVVDGTAIFRLLTLKIGTYVITAIYKGEASLSASAASNSVVEHITTIGTRVLFRSSQASVARGAFVTLTARVVPVIASRFALTGNIIFREGSTHGFIAIKKLSQGLAVVETRTLPVGRDELIAMYGGNAAYSGATSAVLQERILGEPLTSRIFPWFPTLGRLSAALRGFSLLRIGVAGVLLSFSALLASLLLRLLIGVLGFPAEWFNDTYQAHADAARAWFWCHLRRGHVDCLDCLDCRPSIAARRASVASFLLLGAFLTMWSQQPLRAEPDMLWQFLGALLGIAVVTFTFSLRDLSRDWARRRKGQRGHFRPLFGSIVVAGVCVVISRQLSLAPAYLYGLICVYEIRSRSRSAKTRSEEPRLTRTKEKAIDEGEGARAASSIAAILVVCLAAWLVFLCFGNALARSAAHPFGSISVAVLTTVFVGGLESVAFGLVPLPFLPGREIWEWSPWWWGAVSVVGMGAFTTIVLAPGTGAMSRIPWNKLGEASLAFASFFFVSVVFMGYLWQWERRQPRHLKGRITPGPGSTTVSALSKVR